MFAEVFIYCGFVQFVNLKFEEAGVVVPVACYN